MVSCEDYLEEKTYSQLTPGLMFENEANAQLAVNGIYIAHFEERWGEQMFWPASWGTLSQEFSFFNNQNTADLGVNSSWARFNMHWFALYKGVNSANGVIRGVTDMSADVISDEARKQFIAEAKFLRAHAYFVLWKAWGGVSLLTEPTQNPEQALLPRSSAQETFNLIEADLKAAQADLPVNYKGGFPDAARGTKGSATAMLAQLYSYASGQQFKGNGAVGGDANFNNITTSYWNEARAELFALIDETNPSQAKAPYMYSLEPDLKWLYTGGEQVSGLWQNVRDAKSWGQEIIWSTNWKPEIVDGTWFFNHWGGRYFSPYSLSRFEAGEYRAVVKHDSAHAANLGRIVSRHFKRNRSGNDNENDAYFARYAGMLLLMAHVENEINSGPTALAEACLNAVRARARAGDGVTTYTVPADVATGLSYDQFRNEVYDEVIVELFYEQQFWWWAQMTGHWEADWSLIGSGADGDKGPYNSAWKLWPIPETDIVTSGGVILQNAGH